jgi:hypothetical protein
MLRLLDGPGVKPGIQWSSAYWSSRCSFPATTSQETTPNAATHAATAEIRRRSTFHGTARDSSLAPYDRRIDRWLLNTLPVGALAALLVGGALSFGVGGFLLIRRVVASHAAHAEVRSLSSAFGLASGLFSFVLAFTIGQLYSNYNRAEADSKLEATQVAQLLRTADGLPSPLASTVRAQTLVYARDVRNVEWPLLRKGESSVRAWQDLDRVYATLEGARATSSAKSDPYYADTVSALDAVVVARGNRLDDVNLSVPPVFAILLIAGALLAISSTWYFKPYGEPLQLVMIGASSALVGFAMFVALELDYPFSGDIAVSSAPFKLGTLLLLSGRS